MRRSVGTVLLASLLAVAVVGTSGCFRRQFPTQRHFVIDVVRSAAPRATASGVLQLRPVSAAPQYDRKSFVYRTGDVTFVDDFYNAFYVPPTRMLAGLARNWFGSSGLFTAVVGVDSASKAQWLLELRLSDLYVDRSLEGEHAAVAGVEMTLLELGKTGAKAVFEQRYLENEPATARNSDAYVQAWGVALGRVFSRMENDLAVALDR
jgi:ABC-type uncharacterized transport system auxiliary subunit